ncbi:DUF6518 family protein [Amycolatopsis jiangsuensis]|uniref:Uncharacterized protein n=1 Tax=Amycolatopsis jiangsuensis TaxID=1181879 RepID=A0A840IQX7_9PSEU|nr:DUF6518 family protein [Amycolatopsis jiangsuensis]MBB4683578.1 hypothetical protein [Amycolatopsis jiangsuensis]
MTAAEESSTQPDTAARRAVVTKAIVAAAAGLLLGGLTSYAQAVMPHVLASLANSASGWTLVTVLVVWLLREKTAPSAVFGLVVFVALVLGYAAAASLRGFFYDPVMFGVIAVVAGPFVGAATSWLRRRCWRAALGSALLAGIALGECLYGMTVVADTTSWVYWTLIGVAGVVLLAVVLARRAGDALCAVTGVAATVVVACVFFLSYRML